MDMEYSKMGFGRAWMWSLCCLPWRRRTDAVRDDWAGEWHYAYVFKVYDGDTITVDVHRHGRWVRQSIRLAGIDTPELRTSDAHEKALAETARAALSDAILNKQVWLYCTGREKYGRILGEIYPTTWCRSHAATSYNAWLLEQGHAKPYHGGKKDGWTP